MAIFYCGNALGRRGRTWPGPVSGVSGHTSVLHLLGSSSSSSSSFLFIIIFTLVLRFISSTSSFSPCSLFFLSLLSFSYLPFNIPQQRGSTHLGYVSSVVAQVVRDHQHPGRTLLHSSLHFRTAVSFRLSDSSRDCQSRESTSSACSSTMGVSMLLFHFKRCAFNVFRFASASVFKKMPARLSSAWFSSPSSFFLSAPSLPLYSSRPPSLLDPVLIFKLMSFLFQSLSKEDLGIKGPSDVELSEVGLGLHFF